MFLLRGSMSRDESFRRHVAEIRRKLEGRLPEEIAKFRGTALFSFPLCQAALTLVRKDWALVEPFQIWAVPPEKVRLAEIYLVKDPAKYAESWRVGEEEFNFPTKWELVCPSCGGSECPYAEQRPWFPKVWEAMFQEEDGELLLEMDELPQNLGELEAAIRAARKEEL